MNDVAEARNRRSEHKLSATGEVTDQLGFVASYTYSNGEFLDNVSGTVRAGNKMANMPEHSAALWARYDATSKLGIGLGAATQGERFAATDNTVVMPSFTRFDAALFYKLTEGVSAQLNVENLADERYYVFANSNDNITPGSPTAITRAFLELEDGKSAAVIQEELRSIVRIAFARHAKALKRTGERAPLPSDRMDLRKELGEPE